MYRIETYDEKNRWRWACPHPKRHRDWRVVDGLFECRGCGETYSELVNLKSGERVPREQIEVVGPHAGHKGGMGKPTVEEP